MRQKSLIRIYRMRKTIIIYKPRVWDKILFVRLKELENSIKGLKSKEFIGYSYVYEKLCRNFSVKKEELKEILEYLKNAGFIEVSPIGIKLNYKLEDDN